MVSGAIRAADMQVATIGAVDYATALEGLSLKQAQLMLTTQGIVGEEQKQILVQQGLIASSDRMSASLVSEALANNGLNKEKLESILIRAGLMNEQTKELITENAVTESKLRAILAEKGIQGAKADTLIASILQTGQNGKEAISWNVLGTSIANATKQLWAFLTTNPVGWAILATTGIVLLTKGYDALIGRQEKLARTKLEGLDEDISTYDEEIQSLETLQTKLESAKGNKSELAKIQNELNDAIGETAGLLNGEGKAYDIANAKLKANIELKKQQRQQAINDKVSASKDLFDNNVYERSWGVDVSGDKMKDYAETYSSYIKLYKNMSDEARKTWQEQYDISNAEDYAFFLMNSESSVGFDKSDWSEYWNEQVQTAYDVFDDVIQDYNGVGGQDFIKNLIDNMVRGGSDLSEIGTIITQVTENPELQEAINSYWESLVNPEIDSEEALNSVKTMIDDIIKQYPQLETFFNDFYSGIVSGAKAVADTVSDTSNKIDVSNIFKLENTDLGKLSESIDKIQDAYKTLYSAIEEYNSEGALSVDTLQSVIALGDDWLDYLVDEQGNLKLDQEALQNLTASRLNDMRVQAINNLIDNVSKIKTDADANKYLKSTNYALAKSYEEVSQKALESARAKMQDAVASGTLSQVSMDAAMSKATADIAKINKLFNNTNISPSSIMGNSSSSKSEKKWKDYLDKLLSSYEAELELGLIDFESFTDKSFDLVEKFYREGKISAEEYWDSINQLYEKQLNIYDKVLNAVTRRIDKEIEGIEDIIDGLEDQNDALEKQKDNYDKVLSVVEEVYDKEIERLEDEKDLLQDKIDALNDEADAYELVRKKEEALYALEQAQKNRTKKIYVEGKGYIYDQDHEAIRDAQDNLHNIKTEEVITKLEKEQEALDESIKVLEEYKQKWSEISDVYEKEQNKQLAIALWGKDYESKILQNRVSDIEVFKTQYLAIQAKIDDNQSLIDSYNEKIEYYNNLKEQWSDIADTYEQSVEDQYATMILGRDWEKIILDERSEKLNDFKTEYVSIQEQIAKSALESAEAQVEAANKSSEAIQKVINNKKTVDNIDWSKVYGNPKIVHKYRVVRKGDGKTVSDGYTDPIEAYRYIFEREKYSSIKGMFEVEAYSKGGVVGSKKSPLDTIAQQVGEDRVITVKEGERVLTPVQNDMWEKWTKALPNLQEFAKAINFTPNIKLPDYSHLSGMVQRQSQQPIVQSFNITMPNVTNNTSADRIMRDLQRLPLDAYQYSKKR